jgi:hypothetical protein
MLAAGATIAAKSMLSPARVVARSFAEHHPGVPFYVLLADEVDGYFDPAQEPYELLLLHELDIPDEARLRFVLTQQQLTYAATPYLLAKLLELGHDRVVFVKQESLVLGELTSVVRDLPPGGVALTPHLLEPLAGGDAADRELMVLLSGVFNAGLIGLAAGETSTRLLEWWQERVAADCRYAAGEGVHYEQRWLDLAPAYFDDVHIVRDPRINVGHWNLPERLQPAYGLFRFSGYDPDRPEYATRYTPRVRVDELAAGAEVFAGYRAALVDAGWEETRNWPYAYDSFADGTPIPEVARDIYRRQPDAARFGDPFDPSGEDSFFRWLAAPAGPRAPNRFWLGVYDGRPDLQAAFPDALGRHRRAFKRWTRSFGAREHNVSEALR